MTCVAAIAMRVEIRTARSVSTVSVGSVDEDDVDVADVVELARAGLAHRDDGQRCRGDLGPPGRATSRRATSTAAVERRAGEVGEPRGDRRERRRRGRVQHIVGGELSEVAAVPRPAARIRAASSDGTVDGLGQRRRVYSAWRPRFGGRCEEQVEFGGAALQELAEPHRCPEHAAPAARWPPGRRGSAAGRRDGSRPGARADASAPSGSAVEDHRAGHVPTEHRQVGAEPATRVADSRSRLVRELREPQPGEFGAGRLRPAGHRSAGADAELPMVVRGSQVGVELERRDLGAVAPSTPAACSAARS